MRKLKNLQVHVDGNELSQTTRMVLRKAMSVKICSMRRNKFRIKYICIA